MERKNSRKKTTREEKKEKYIKEHYEGVMFRVHSGERERLRAYAKKIGLSVNEFLYHLQIRVALSKSSHFSEYKSQFPHL